MSMLQEQQHEQHRQYQPDQKCQIHNGLKMLCCGGGRWRLIASRPGFNQYFLFICRVFANSASEAEYNTTFAMSVR